MWTHLNLNTCQTSCGAWQHWAQAQACTAVQDITASLLYSAGDPCLTNLHWISCLRAGHMVHWRYPHLSCVQCCSRASMAGKTIHTRKHATEQSFVQHCQGRVVVARAPQLLCCPDRKEQRNGKGGRFDIPDRTLFFVHAHTALQVPSHSHITFLRTHTLLVSLQGACVCVCVCVCVSVYVPRLASFTCQEISNSCWAVAKLAHYDCHTLDNVADHIATMRLTQLLPQHMSNLAWVSKNHQRRACQWVCLLCAHRRRDRLSGCT